MARTRTISVLTCLSIFYLFIATATQLCCQIQNDMPLAYELNWIQTHGEIVDVHDSDYVSIGSGRCKITCRLTEEPPIIRTSIGAQYERDFCLEIIYTIQADHDSAIVAFGWAGPTFLQSNVFAHRLQGDCGKWTPSNGVPNPLPYSLPPQSTGKEDTLRIFRRGDVIDYYLRSQHVHNEDASDVHITGADVWITVFPGTTISVHTLRLYQQHDPIDTVSNFGSDFKRSSETSNESIDPLVRIAPFSLDKSFFATLSGVRPSLSMFLGHRDSSHNLYRYKKDTWFRSPVRPARPHVVNWSSADGRCILVSVESAQGKPQLRLYNHNRNGWSFAYNVTFPTRSLVGMLPEATAAPDMKTIIFSGWVDVINSARDLWITHHVRDSIWSDPVPLGSTVNTLQTESEPFLAANGSRLYFASDGHAGYGGSDIFVSTRNDTSWTSWTRPQNLGRRVNSTNHEYSLRMDERNRFWYLIQCQPYRPRYVIVFCDTTIGEAETNIEYMWEYPYFQRRGVVERLFCDSSFREFSATPPKEVVVALTDIRSTIVTYSLSTVTFLYNVSWAEDSIEVDSGHLRLCHNVIQYLIQSGIPAQRLNVAPNYELLSYDDDVDDEEQETESEPEEDSTPVFADERTKFQALDSTRQKSRRLQNHPTNCLLLRFH